jgi:E3 ubiquitin-protein ligase RGLG
MFFVSFCSKGIDFSISNQYAGVRTFGGKSLHTLDARVLNPYQRVIIYLGETLEELDEDGRIPAYGFGDATTRDATVFPISRQV